MAENVTLRRYLDVIEAEMDRARLEAAGIAARVIEPTSWNPAYTAAAGGVTLDVPAEDAKRAEAILADPGVDPDEPGDEQEDGPDVRVRCPRCESEYCTFGRPTVRGHASPGAAASVAVVFFASLLLRLRARAVVLRALRARLGRPQGGAPEDDAPRARRSLPGVPPPSRAAPGAWAWLPASWAGSGLVMLAVVVVIESQRGVKHPTPHPELGLLTMLVVFASPVVGFLIAGKLAVDVCSQPRCREPLPADAETCPACKGSIAGRVRARPSSTTRRPPTSGGSWWRRGRRTRRGRSGGRRRRRRRATRRSVVGGSCLGSHAAYPPPGCSSGRRNAPGLARRGSASRTKRGTVIPFRPVPATVVRALSVEMIMSAHESAS